MGSDFDLLLCGDSLMSAWLDGAEAACEQALQPGTDTERLLRIAEVHALIAICHELQALRGIFEGIEAVAVE